MAAPQGPTDLTLAAIVDGQAIDAADVVTPLLEAETAIDQARSTLAVSDTDTAVKYLQDAIQAGEGITITKLNTGGDETIQITNAGGAFLNAPDTPDSYSGAAYDVPTVNGGESALEFMPAVPAGCVMPYMGGWAPSGWLLCTGQQLVMKNYKRLLDALITGAIVDDFYGIGPKITVTADAATDKILWTGHYLTNDAVIMFTNSGGALPGGIQANTPYYVINVNTNDFQISLTDGGAPVDITDAGSGTQQVSTWFQAPDMRGRGFFGQDNMGGSSANVVTDPAAHAPGGKMGSETHTLIIDEIPPHYHESGNGGTGAGQYGEWTSTRNAHDATRVTSQVGGGAAHNNMPPVIFGNWIIKY